MPALYKHQPHFNARSAKEKCPGVYSRKYGMCVCLCTAVLNLAGLTIVHINRCFSSANSATVSVTLHAVMVIK